MNVEVVILGFPSLISPVPNKPTVSVDVKQHFNNLSCLLQRYCRLSTLEKLSVS